MAPSATSDIVVPEGGVAKQHVEHVHGAEEKTPLEAISHGPIIQTGERVFSFILNSLSTAAAFMGVSLNSSGSSSQGTCLQILPFSYQTQITC
jgi:hypothetical protein